MAELLFYPSMDVVSNGAGGQFVGEAGDWRVSALAATLFF
jgi:hypothetical protein